MACNARSSFASFNKPNDSMKKTNIYFPALILLGLTLTEVKAQSSLNASGGNATGIGGSASYSVGQLAYTVATGAGGSATAGVQQPIELFTSSHEELESIKLSLSVYPNPASAIVNLQVTDLKWNELSYQLFDLSGKLLADQKITGETSSISIENQPAGSYFLKVRQGNTEIKSFKILKNQ